MSDHDVPPMSRRAGPSRGLSRRVRLHRTVAATLGLVLLVTAALVVLRPSDDGPARKAGRVPVSAAKTTPPSARGATTRSSPVADGSSDSSGEAETVAPGTVPQSGAGRISVVSVPGAESTHAGRTVRYTVELEDGLGVDPAKVAATIRGVLLDAHGWQTKDGVKFVNVSPAESARGARVDIRVTLVSPALTDQLCAPLRTASQVSCWNGERSVLNLRRWMLGDDSYGKDVARYRTYQINHEVGHGLGHNHQTCPATGARAPVMVQQTLNLGGCTAWPYPTGA